jgi:sulfur transfer complex TusBCD TusB component (DsrH family)
MSNRAKTYAIVYDRDEVDTEALHNFISNNETVHNWWHYIKSCYLIKSDLSAREIADALPQSMREGSFLVVEVNLSNSNGWLPEKAWRWIYRRQDEERV